MKKIIIIIITIVMITILPLKVNATALPVGIDPTMMELGEFTSWVMLLFGVHDNNSNSNDMFYDTDFIDSLNNSGWTIRDKSPKQVLQEMYQSYLNNRYKVEITQEQFSAFASAISEAFQGQATKAIRIYSESSIGEYTKQYVEGELNNVANGLSTISIERAWNDYWNSVIDIKSIYSVITQYTEYDDYNFYHIYIYCFEEDAEPIINQDNSITYTGRMRLFDCFLYQRFVGNTNTTVGYADYPSGTTASTTNTPIYINKDMSSAGLAFIDAGIRTILETGDATLVTPYTDVGTNDIAIPVPNSTTMDDLVSGVKIGTKTITQAIEASQSQVVDASDSQAMENAISATASSVPDYQTYALSELFPFCIPFDFVRILGSFSDTPKTPEFDIKLPTYKDGELAYLEFHISLEQFNGVAQVCRTLELIGFCIGLCLITRNIMIRS